MGRGGAKGRERAGLPANHWTKDDPNKELWSPSQLAQAQQVPSRAVWNALYGGPPAFTSTPGILSRANRHLLLAERSAYSSFDRALEGGEGVVQVEVTKSGINLSDLQMHSRGLEDETPFHQLNETQMSSLADLLEREFHCRSDLCWSDIWIEGRDLGGGGGVARFDRDPHAIKVVRDTVENLGPGGEVVLDQEGRLFLYRTKDGDYSIEFLQDPFTLSKKRLPKVFSTARGIEDEIVGVARGAKYPLLPRQVRRSGQPGVLLVEIGSHGSSKLFARSVGFWGEQIFRIEDQGGGVVSGKYDKGVLRLGWEEWPLRLSRDGAALLSGWIRSREKLN